MFVHSTHFHFPWTTLEYEAKLDVFWPCIAKKAFLGLLDTLLSQAPAQVCVGGQRHKATRFPSRMMPRKRQGCHSSATAVAKNWMWCGEKANEDNHTGCAKKSTWGSLDIVQSHSLQGENNQPSSFHNLRSGNLFHMKQKIVEPLCASLQ